jgi:hypothetical protein
MPKKGLAFTQEDMYNNNKSDETIFNDWKSPSEFIPSRKCREGHRRV